MRKKFIKEMALVLSAATVMSSVTACSNSGGGNTEATTQAVTTAIDDGQGNGGQDNTSEAPGKKLAGDYSKEEPIEKIVLQAEDGEFKGNVKAVESTDNGATGKGYVDGFNERGSDEWSYTFTVPQDGHYDFSISSNSGSDNNYKENYFKIDGQEVASFVSQSKNFKITKVRGSYLTEGEHTISIAVSWGYINLDKVTIETSEGVDPEIYNVSPKLVDENATDNTKRLFSYLTDIYGTAFLSGQYCDAAYGMEMQSILLNTDPEVYPAILGLDMGYYSQSAIDHTATTSATENAIAYWEKDGGIVTYCWHWLPPEQYHTGEWYSTFRKENVKMNVTAMVNGEDPEGFELLMKDVDLIADEFLKLQDAGVPVIWRPLHEASGGWFWWGAEGADTYKKLYIAIYERLQEKGVHNLIWLWNGQNADWYPGDKYVDIIGEDIYPGEHEHSSQVDKFLQAVDYTGGKKMVVLSENGCLFDPEQAVKDNAMWGFWATWGGEFVLKSSNMNRYSEQYTSLDKLKEFYNSEYVITRDELPDLKTYEIKE
jgi:mannan endo-1,4-beta-mannosidase